MGDFYELFFEDARLASKLLNISLTHRGKLEEIPIPMAGIPFHAAATYIDRITSLGKKVIICEQVEDPKLAKGIVKRAVTQIVSPGIPFDLDKTASIENKYIAVSFFHENIFLILLDYTTGDFVGFVLKTFEEMLEKLHLYNPREFLTYPTQWSEKNHLDQYLENHSILKTNLQPDYFDHTLTGHYISKVIKNYKRDKIINEHTGLLNAIGAMSFYITSTQSLDVVSHIKPFQLQNTLSNMNVNFSTLAGLEILPQSKETYKESILGFMDRTLSAMGARKLKKIFQAPLKNKNEIIERQKLIEFFIKNSSTLESTRDILQDLKDIERIMAKLSSRKINNGDLLNLAQAIQIYKKLHLTDSFKNILKIKTNDLKKLNELEVLILKTINDEIGANADKGNIIKSGANKERDKLAKLSQKSNDALMEMEAEYRKKTGIGNLKIKYNNVAGYFIEISKSHLNKVPKSFERTQTLVNNERYQTNELIEFEKEILTAQSKLQKLEKEIFESVCAEVTNNNQLIMQIGDELAMLDCMQSLAVVAYSEGFTCPEFLPQKIFQTRNAWHPLIKSVIQDQFVPHNLNLDHKQFFGLITGPNMAGKTTVMREMAIIQFLAQIGSYVPAESATLSIVDYIFSRLGASDDIMRGQSTFMVEMSETAEIIRHATENSLILLDEIGRGTSTYDGLSIAWALCEYLTQKTRALTLFSTHYHELIELVETIPNAKNLTVKTINENGKVQFLYRLIEEGATQSFGIHVAELAGLPKQILKRSQELLKTLEKNHNHAHDLLSDKTSELPLFSTPKEINLTQQLKTIDISKLTPLEALNKLHELQNLS